MSAEPAEKLNPAAEVDRFEAQRQAFSRLMARFTADRDAMIAAVQQCNERIDSLALRLAGGGVAADGDGAADGGAAQASVAGLAEVRSLTERFLAQQQHALAEVRTATDRALQRADESLRRVREMVESGAQRDASAEELRQAVDTFDDRLARLEEMLVAVDEKEASAAGDGEAARLLSERLAAVEEQLRGVDEVVEALRQAQRVPPAEEVPTSSVLELGLRDLRDQVAQLESLASWTPKLQRLWFSLVASAVVAVFAIIFVR